MIGTILFIFLCPIHSTIFPTPSAFIRHLFPDDFHLKRFFGPKQTFHWLNPKPKFRLTLRAHIIIAVRLNTKSTTVEIYKIEFLTISPKKWLSLFVVCFHAKLLAQPRSQLIPMENAANLGDGQLALKMWKWIKQFLQILLGVHRQFRVLSSARPTIPIVKELFPIVQSPKPKLIGGKILLKRNLNFEFDHQSFWQKFRHLMVEANLVKNLGQFEMRKLSWIDGEKLAEN